MIVLLALDGTVLVRSDATMAGSASTAVVGRPAWDGLWSARRPEGRPRLEHDVQAAARGACVRDRLELQSADEQQRSVEITLTPLYDSDGRVRFILGEEADVDTAATMGGGGRAAGEEHGAREPAGRPPSPRGGIAHEINNGLAGIKNAFQLIRDVVPPDSEYFEYLDLIDRELDHIARLVAEMPRTTR